jgi:cholesterol oxidase
MARLSKDAYQAIVIGSGFGGSVAACRLAQAGVDVGLLERGRRYPPGGFPRHPVRYDLMDWHHGGPYELRPMRDVLVVQGAGYGGGSLIYANVQMRPPAEAFDGGWPAGYSRAALDPYYDLVAHMLDITPVPDDAAAGQPPPKTRLMEAAAARLGRSAQFFRPNIAVRFEGAGESPTPNKFGALQSGCINCGACDIGCNVGAKNTLDLNYLTLAERFGAEPVTQAEVTWLAPTEEGFAIRFRDLEDAGAEHTVAAEQVFLCLGAVNSTELLLRCRDQHRTLTRLPPKLGTSYSANGDFLALGLGTSPSFEATNGPTITAACIYEFEQDGRRIRLTVEEGGYSTQLYQALPLLHPVRLAELLGRELGDRLEGHARGLHTLLREEGDTTAALLVMGRDSADGTIELAPPHHRLRVRWDTPSNMALYAAETAACRELVAALGGRLAFPPTWSFLGQPSAPHNLGGCPMAGGPEAGVVDPEGNVFGYPGLHVLDSAIIPAAVGVNPSHTIAAVAERCIEATIRRLKGEERWRAPEAEQAARPDLPEDRVSLGRPATSTPGGGMRWREGMRGSFEIDGAVRTARFAIAVGVPDVKVFLADAAHPARVAGRVHVEGLTKAPGAPIEGGTFHLLVDEGEPRARTMWYSLPFHSSDGRPWLLRGRKDVHGRTIRDFWRATTILEARLEARDDQGQRASGTLRIGPLEVGRLLASLRPVGAPRPRYSALALWRFVRFFARTLIRLYLVGRKEAQGERL